MGNTPTLSIRLPTEHHELIRATVARLKADAGFAHTLRAVLAQDSEAAAPLPSGLSLADLARRVELIEAWQARHDNEAVSTADTAIMVLAATVQAEEPAAPTAPIATTTAPWTVGDGKTKQPDGCRAGGTRPAHRSRRGAG